MSIKYFLCFCCIIACISCQVTKAQVNIPSEFDTCEIVSSSKFFEVDRFGNIYVPNEKNEIIKYTSGGRIIFTYANSRNGNVTSIDATNPMKLLVFYDDFNKVIWLDNSLSQIASLDLEPIFGDITSAATSNDGGIWLYSPIQNKLFKTTIHGEILRSSNNLSDFGITNLQIYKIMERNNHVIILTDDNRALIFDNFAQFTQVKHLDKYQAIDVFDDILYYIVEGKIHSTDLINIAEENHNIVFQSLPLDKVNYMRITKQAIYYLSDNCINRLDLN